MFYFYISAAYHWTKYVLVTLVVSNLFLAWGCLFRGMHGGIHLAHGRCTTIRSGGGVIISHTNKTCTGHHKIETIWGAKDPHLLSFILSLCLMSTILRIFLDESFFPLVPVKAYLQFFGHLIALAGLEPGEHPCPCCDSCEYQLGNLAPNEKQT